MKALQDWLLKLGRDEAIRRLSNPPIAESISDGHPIGTHRPRWLLTVDDDCYCQVCDVKPSADEWKRIVRAINAIPPVFASPPRGMATSEARKRREAV